VDVLALAEGFQQGRVLADMGQHTQLDLAVVHRQQVVPFRGDEGPPDLATLLRAHRDVLQVGVVAADAAGDRAGLVEAGVQPAGTGVDQRRQSIDVSALELGQLAVLQDQADDRVQIAQVFQHVGGGGEAVRGLAHAFRR